MADMTQSNSTASQKTEKTGSITRFISATELDTRLLGMVGALLLIWIGFHILSGGLFLTPRNLWNLSVQTASVAVMATGMVLVIVTRNIDLSVGSILGFSGMIMGVMQAEILPQLLGFEHWATWIVTLLTGILVGGAIGMLQGSIIAFLNVPSFIVTLGGLLVWRIFRLPAIGIGFADILDLAAVDGGLQHFLLAGEQEVRIRVGRRALDEDVVTFRLDLEHFGCLKTADFLVVEGDVEGVLIFDQAVITNNRNAFGNGLLHRRANRVAILRQNDQRIGALRNQRLHIGQLLCGRRLRIGGNVFRAGLVECCLDGRLIRLPALFLEIRPGNANDEISRDGGGMQGNEYGRTRQKLGKRIHDVLPVRAKPHTSMQGKRPEKS